MTKLGEMTVSDTGIEFCQLVFTCLFLAKVPVMKVPVLSKFVSFGSFLHYFVFDFEKTFVFAHFHHPKRGSRIRVSCFHNLEDSIGPRKCS